MPITPNTNLFILKSPLTLSNKHQITFPNKQKQFEYFYSLPKLEIDASSYQRKNEIIRYPEHIDNIIGYNYCMYQNENYTDKWFYAFITNMRYINDGLTEISITTDVFQTWQFDIIYKQSFIEREMIDVSQDIAGANLLPEGLETGEFKVGGTAEIDDLECAYVVAYSGDEIKNNDDTSFHTLSQDGYSYNGIFSSITFIVTNEYGFNVIMRVLNEEDNSNHVITVFTIPKLAVKSLMPEDTGGQHTYSIDYLDRDFKENPIIKNLASLPTSIDGYTPRNKKLLTYPYIYLGFNPPNGTSKIFRYEDFTNNTPVFKIMSEINPNPTVYFIPQNYRGANGDSLSDAVTLSGYPNISYKTDVFNTWLAQNSEILSLQMQQEQFNYEINSYKTGIQGGANIISNAFTGNIGDTLLGGANIGLDLASLDKNHEFYVKQQMAQIEKQKMLPDNVNLSSSNATLLGYEMIDKNIFTRYNIKRQFAERIDKFFDMYGYLTNSVKVPNINNRPNWNYIKTQGANILGDIPQEDLMQIKEFFNNGITLWHNTNNFLDYSVNNR